MSATASPIARIAGAARALLPGALVAWLALVLLGALVAPRIGGPWPLLFLAGALAIPAGVLFALGALAAAPFSHTPPAPQPRAAALALATAAAVTTACWWVTPALADALVPATLDIRAAIVRAAGAALACLAGGLAGSALWMRRLRTRRPPLWLFGALLLAGRALAAQDLGIVFGGRHHLLEVGSLAALFVAFARLPVRLPAAAAGAATAGGALLAAASVAALFLGLDHQPAARATFHATFAGAGRVVVVVRSAFDFDGDGHASILGGQDCDDADPAVYPGAVEIVGNGKDDNCLGGDLAAAPEDPPATAPVRHRPILLITVDAWRADTLEATDTAGRPAMPRVRELLRDAAWFPSAYAHAPYTDYSLRALVTGRLPLDFTTDGDDFWGQDRTLFELLEQHGYRTRCQLQIWLLSPYVFRGCREVDMELARENAFFHGQTSPRTTDAAIAALDTLAARGEPYLFWVHYFDPHSNYLPVPGAPFDADTDRGRYHQEIWATDQAIGRLLDHAAQIGFFEEGIAVLTGDHGELLGEDGRQGHAYWLEPDTLRVPLILRGAGIPAGRHATRVRLVDVFPTLLSLALGAEAPSDGRSLEPIWRGEDTADRDAIAVSWYHGTNQRSIATGPWMLVQDLKAGTERLWSLGDGHREVARPDDPAVLAATRDALGRAWDRAVNDVVLGRKARQLHVRRLPRAVWARYEAAWDRFHGLATGGR